MDPTLYKDIQVKRGHIYHYYYSPPTDVNKPTLLFIHGFPSRSSDWKYQVAHFQDAGYGTLVPDCLGYGGTSKPIDPAEYRNALLAKDIVEIVEFEGPKNVVAIAHDWGSVILSRIADLFPDRFLGFAWLAVLYTAPSTQPLDLQGYIQFLRSITGRDMVGYWELFTQEDGYKLCEENLDSFLSLLYPESPDLLYEWLSPSGKLAQWLKEKRTSPRPQWLTEEEYNSAKAQLSSGGLRAPLCYYRVVVGDYSAPESEEIVKVARKFDCPALFVTGTRDGVCDATVYKAGMAKSVPHAKIVELDTGHWIMLEATERVNAELEEWVKGL
ncbi:alpha/beta-hydrolase [Fomes fomentarius]|nr:alpha/beta-hydrolase [Fomes fomentarius]